MLWAPSFARSCHNIFHIWKWHIFHFFPSIYFFYIFSWSFAQNKSSPFSLIINTAAAQKVAFKREYSLATEYILIFELTVVHQMHYSRTACINQEKHTGSCHLYSPGGVIWLLPPETHYFWVTFYQPLHTQFLLEKLERWLLSATCVYNFGIKQKFKIFFDMKLIFVFWLTFLLLAFRHFQDDKAIIIIFLRRYGCIKQLKVWNP